MALLDDDPTKKCRVIDIEQQKDYYAARMRYREAYPDEETELDDKHDQRHEQAMNKEVSLQKKTKKKMEREKAQEARQELNRKLLEERADKRAQASARKAEEEARKEARKVGKKQKNAQQQPLPHVALAAPPAAAPAPAAPINAVPIPLLLPPAGGIQLLPAAVPALPAAALLPSRPAVPAPSSRSGRRVAGLLGGERKCDCGCDLVWDGTLMVSCRGGLDMYGTSCTKRLSRKCCPSWFCYECSQEVGEVDD